MAPDRSIDRSIPSSWSTKPRPGTEPKAAFWTETGSVSLSRSATLIILRTTPRSSLFILSLSLSLVLRFFLPDLGISRLRPSSVFRRKSAATPSSAGSSLSFDHAMPRRRLSFVEMKSVNNMFHVQFFIIPSFQRFQSLR